MGCSFHNNWSITKQQLLDQCNRKFLYQYFSSEEPYQVKAAILARLTTFAGLVGKICDQTISDALISFAEDGVTPQNLALTALQRFDAAVESSRRLNALVTDEANQEQDFVGFHSDYYRYSVPQGAVRSFRNRITSSLNNFELGGPLSELITAGSQTWGPIRRGREPAPTFRKGGLILSASYDFYYANHNTRTVTILDWKTGQRSREAERHAELQAAVYAAYISSQSRFANYRVLAGPVWLYPTLNRDVQEVTVARGDELISHLEKSAGALATRLRTTTRDGRKIYCLNKEDMPASPEERKCFYCSFRAICPEGSQLVASLSDADIFSIQNEGRRTATDPYQSEDADIVVDAFAESADDPRT